MPNPQEILDGLGGLARDARWVALVWHLVAVAGVAAAAVWRPKGSVAAILATAPLVSASALAFVSGNLFNGIVLAVSVVVLCGLGAAASSRRLELDWHWTTTAGMLALAYAFVYPHFVTIRSVTDVLFTPLGVVPCPTLSFVLGLGLVSRGFGSRAWTLSAAALGLFYAVFGIFRLGVWLDVGLLLIAATLAAEALELTIRRGPVPRPQVA